MAPRKGQEKSKGKQLVPKALSETPVPEEVSSEEEGETVDWSAIMN